MSVENEVLFKQYDCDGVVDSFPAFIDYLGDEENLLVTLFNELDGSETTLVLGVGYTVTAGLSGSVETTEVYSSDFKLTISLNVAFTQETDLQFNASYDPDVLEGMNDKNTLLSRQNKNTTDRTLKLAVTDSGNELTLPPLASGLQKYVFINSLGEAEYKTGTIPDSETISAEDIPAVDAGGYFAGEDLEAITQEIGAKDVAQDTALATLETIVDPVGGLKKFSVYKDRSAKGLLPYAFDNKVSTTGTYADLYAEVGDLYETMHTDAGDVASGVGFFYPTPIPGYVEKLGIPDTAVVNATDDIDDSTELITLTTADYDQLKLFKSVNGDGVPVRVKLVSGALPGGIADEKTIYYTRFETTPDIELYDTEANAIDTSGTTGRINLTDAVGTFVLSQEGIVWDDTGQRHFHETYSLAGGGGGIRLSNSVDSNGTVGGATIAQQAREPVTDGVNGTPRTSNETRSRQQIIYGYIKALYVLGG